MSEMNNNQKYFLAGLIESATEECGLNPSNKYDNLVVNLAVGIFKSIKKFEKATVCYHREFGKTLEETNARHDLEAYFGFYNHKEMTLNQMYNLHCSEMTNAIIKMILEGDLDDFLVDWGYTPEDFE